MKTCRYYSYKEPSFAYVYRIREEINNRQDIVINVTIHYPPIKRALAKISTMR